MDRLELDPHPDHGLPEDGGEAFAALWVGELAYYVFEAFGIGLAEVTSILIDVFSQTDSRPLPPLDV